jgi:hypothetical protein
MANTYTSGWQTVSNGDTTTEDPSNMVGKENINVLSSQIRWRGVTTSSTETNTVTEENYNGDFYTSPPLSNGIPSVPDGTSFATHNATLTIKAIDNGDGQQTEVESTFSWPNGEGKTVTTTLTEDFPGSEADIIYDNHAGESVSASITVIGGNDSAIEAKLAVETSGNTTETTTTYYDTQDPSVSNDVSASYNGTLSDGSTTSWINLSGLDPSNEHFSHSISGSNKVEFQFEFDWEISLPTTVAKYRVPINGTTKDVILADPTDNALDYNFYRTQVDGDGVLAYDVVDPSDPDALPYYIYHPTHGKLALREKK